MNLSSRNLKLIIGVFYLLILFLGLYYLFSLIDVRDLTSYEFIKSNKEIIIDYKNNNFPSVSYTHLTLPTKRIV